MYSWKKWKIGEIGGDIFPKQLKNIPNCPKKLYFRGRWREEVFEKVLAIVGSRAMSRYGSEVVEKLMPGLVADKITVISGFMYGVDAKAHKECLGLGGTTVAVLGSGLDCLYPAENDELYEEILKKDGLVISEYEPDFKPTLWSFPQRNRIVAGLANKGVVVVEAGMKSGSLITADMAKKIGRRIWAVPGNLTAANSQGTNWLIRTGAAKILTAVEEITERPAEQKQMELFDQNSDETERLIWKKLEIEPATTDELAAGIGLNVSEISVKLSMLAMRGLVEEDGGKFYAVK